VFGFAACLVLVEAMVLCFPNWWTYGTFLGLYMATTAFVAFDTYYIGVGRIDSGVALFLARLCFKKFYQRPTVILSHLL